MFLQFGSPENRPKVDSRPAVDNWLQPTFEPSTQKVDLSLLNLATALQRSAPLEHISSLHIPCEHTT